MLLGCDSQKALAALFREADPNTDFDIARSYKWMQDRAVPRSAKLYEEWGRLLDVGRSGGWLAACDLGDFVAALEARHGAAAATLRAAAGIAPDAGAVRGPRGFLPGRFAVYSLAQSPHFHGQLIRGDLRISPAGEAEPGHPARLRERFAGLDVAWSGAIEPHAQGLSADLRSECGTFAPVSLALLTPTIPGSLLVGLQMGFVSLQPGAQRPYATRIAGVRVRGDADAALARGNRYLPADEEIGDDLAALDLPMARAPGFAAALASWLREPVSLDAPVSPGPVAELVSAADRLWLATL